MGKKSKQRTTDARPPPGVGAPARPKIDDDDEGLCAICADNRVDGGHPWMMCSKCGQLTCVLCTKTSAKMSKVKGEFSFTLFPKIESQALDTCDFCRFPFPLRGMREGVDEQVANFTKIYETRPDKAAHASYCLAEYYDQGGGSTLKSPKKALRFLEFAADRGIVVAMVDLGNMHRNGEGTKINPKKAMKIWRIAAEFDGPAAATAQNAIGVLYTYGEGTVASHDEAAKWYTRAAENGNARAQHNIGDVMLWGHGETDRDASLAASWFVKAAAQGHLGSMYNLAQMKLIAHGTDEDIDGAMELLRSAVKLGSDESAGLLELLDNVDVDVVRDHMAANLASSHGGMTTQSDMMPSAKANRHEENALSQLHEKDILQCAFERDTNDGPACPEEVMRKIFELQQRRGRR